MEVFCVNCCSWSWFNILPKCSHFLRILGGVTDSFVFILHREEFIVRENVFVQHLTDVSFNAAKQKEFLLLYITPLLLHSFLACHLYLLKFILHYVILILSLLWHHVAEFFGKLSLLFCEVRLLCTSSVMLWGGVYLWVMWPVNHRPQQLDLPNLPGIC